MIEYFLVLQLKGQFNKRMYSFAQGDAGPLYGPEDRHETF
jgi:hypothetical protein